MSEMLDHVEIRVSDLAASRRLYEAALAELGYGVCRDRVTTGAHIAFAAQDEDSVRRWYDAALASGGVDNGPPGPRPHYSPGYYGAFVLDLDGNNVEAVYHAR